MREMGVGDLAVPRKMQQIGQAFYGRQAAYRAALAEPPGKDEALLVAALARNVFAGLEKPEGALRLARYVREADRRLAGAGFAAGRLPFPEPAEVPI